MVYSGRHFGDHEAQARKNAEALVEDLQGRGAKVVVVGPVGSDWKANWYVSVPAYEHYGVTGIPFIYIPQSVSFFKAMERGINPDVPDGLDAWIELPGSEK